MIVILIVDIQYLTSNITNIEEEERLRHHVCYFPEKIAYVHYECHRKIHDTPLTIFIQYNDGDSRKFYAMKENKNEGGSSIKSRLLSQ
jgi:hypothetical protein